MRATSCSIPDTKPIGRSGRRLAAMLVPFAAFAVFAACAKDPAEGTTIGGSDLGNRGGASSSGGTGSSRGGSAGTTNGAAANNGAGAVNGAGEPGADSGAGATGGNHSGSPGTGATSGTGAPADSGVPGCGNSIEGLGSCGQQSVAAQIRHPHMLIVMDKSGSMTDQPKGFDVSIWDGVKAALKTSLDAVKGRVSFGLELFPFPDDPGSPISLDCKDNCCEMPKSPDINVDVEDGATALPKILAAFDATSPGGGTPTAVALHRALEYYTTGAGAGLSGEKFVMLATDGGPNCNDSISCDPSGCSTNLEGHCTGNANCCQNYGAACVDDAATIKEIEALHDAGITTFVVGIPGSEAYSRYLDQFAMAGGAPNPKGSPAYYRVDASSGVAGLTSVFTDITTQLVTACEVALEMPPLDPKKVNLAIDCDVVPSGGDGGDGWRIDLSGNPAKIVMEGNLCRYMQKQGARRIDIVFGCPTVR